MCCSGSMSHVAMSVFHLLFCVGSFELTRSMFVFVLWIKSKVKVYSFSGPLCILPTNHHSLEELHQN